MSNNNNHIIGWFYEESVKRFITGLYDGIEGSENNAKMLALGYDKITESLAQGKETAHDGILWTKRFLEWMELLVKNDTDFERQFHFPAKCTAQFRKDVLDLNSRHVTDLDGWIFAISDSFMDGFGVKRKTLSVIFPEICAVISIRMKEESVRYMKREMEKFIGILPIPYVNRATHKDNPIENIGGVPDLEKLRFLMTSMADAESLRTTICFENYCDIQTPVQSIHRGYLGAPVILAGKVTEYRHPYFTIRSHDGEERRFQKAVDIQGITCKAGQYVAVLASMWYNHSHTNTPPPEYSEIFHLWEITEGQAKEFDEFGHKRLRGDTSAYDTASISDPIQKMFVDCNKKIRNARQNYNESETSIIDIDGGILSQQAVDSVKIASFLKNEKGEIHKIMLVECAELLDSSGTVQKDVLVDYICEFYSKAEDTSVRHKFSLMIYLGLIEIDDETEIIHITKKGYKVLSIIKDGEVTSSLNPNKHGIIDLTENRPCKIPSLLLQKIKDGERHEKVMGCDAFWIEKGKCTPDIEKEVDRKISKIGDKIVKALTKITHHGNADNVFMEMEKPKENYFSVKKILEYLTEKKRINVDKKNGYHVDDKDKLQKYLEEEERFCKIDEIYVNTNIRHEQNTGSQTKELIESLAEELVEKGIANKINFPSGVLRYAICDGDCEKEKIDFFSMACRNGAIGKKKTWDYPDEAHSRIRGVVSGSVKDSVKITEKIIKKNIENGFWEIVDGEMLREIKNPK